MESSLTKDQQILESEKLYLDKIKAILESNLSNKDKIIKIRKKCAAHHGHVATINRREDQ